MASLQPPVPERTRPEDSTLAELVSALVWLASGYQQAIELADSLFLTPPITIQARMIAADAIAKRRNELTAVRVRVASLLDEAARLRHVPDHRQLKVVPK